jgi:hypothetical protein
MAVSSCKEVVEKFAGHPEGFSGLFRRLSYVTLLPLLELPHTVVSADLKQAFLDTGLAESNFQQVSLAQLVAFALRSPSHYWSGLAVQWLLDGFPIEESIWEAGDDMISAKRGTQKTRHALFRLLRQWERSP